jgi:hypothetical protein
MMPAFFVAWGMLQLSPRLSLWNQQFFHLDSPAITKMTWPWISVMARSASDVAIQSGQDCRAALAMTGLSAFLVIPVQTGISPG